MPFDHKFTVERTADFELNRVQRKVKDALDLIANQITTVPTGYSIVVNGLNGSGDIVLSPVKVPGNDRIIRRAVVGSRLVAAVNLTDLTDIQTSFEQLTKKPDNIYQTNTGNLSAKRILFILASPL